MQVRLSNNKKKVKDPNAKAAFLSTFRCSANNTTAIKVKSGDIDIAKLDFKGKYELLTKLSVNTKEEYERWLARDVNGKKLLILKFYLKNDGKGLFVVISAV